MKLTKNNKQSEDKVRFTFLYPLIIKVLDITGIKAKLLKSQTKKERLSLIKVNEFPDKVIMNYYCKIIADITVSVLIMFILITAYVLFQKTTPEINRNTITRAEPGQGDERYSLNVSTDKILESIDFEVSEREMTESELEKAIEYAGNYLDTEIKGANSDLSCVKKDLYFPKNIPKLPITIRYEPDDINIISRSGAVKNEDIDKSGIVTGIDIILGYKDREFIHHINVHIYPPEYTEQQLFTKKLRELLSKANETAVQGKEFILPDELEGTKIIWEEKEENIVAKLVLLTVILVLVIGYGAEYSLKTGLKKRSEELLADYPELINKLTLLINAGIPVKSAFVRISNEYQKKKEDGFVNKRFLYEEVKLMCREMDYGLSEAVAYESFGRRCGGTVFLRLSTIIVQNLRKGNSELVGLLNIEAAEAYKEQRDMIKRKGEEAGTKMLIPMAGMLIIVFLIVLIPDFMNM